MADSLLILIGPGLDQLCRIDRDVYGAVTLAELQRACEAACAENDFICDFRQSNDAGQLLEWIVRARDVDVGIVTNPAIATGHETEFKDAYLAIMHGLKHIKRPTIEVHLTKSVRSARRTPGGVRLDSLTGSHLRLRRAGIHDGHQGHEGRVVSTPISFRLGASPLVEKRPPWEEPAGFEGKSELYLTMRSPRATGHEFRSQGTETHEVDRGEGSRNSLQPTAVCMPPDGHLVCVSHGCWRSGWRVHTVVKRNPVLAPWMRSTRYLRYSFL